MPTLDWIGKKAVVNHHQEVPYHLLRDVPELGCGPADSGNLIVEGDNLTALKALLPYYAGQVKCIYIDPKEKRRLGELWAGRSDGQCLFVMPNGVDRTVITTVMKTS